MQGKVINFVSGKAMVKTAKGNVLCEIRGKIKQGQNGIVVGDDVEFDENLEVITMVNERRNVLVRPRVANIDQMLICLSTQPPADLILVDKLIMICNQNKIEPIICITKSDLQDVAYAKNISRQYGPLGVKILTCSSKTGEGIQEVEAVLEHKVTAFAGQSGVGKSALINTIDGSNTLKTQELTKNRLRGKNTTTSCSIFEVKGALIVDTPGFCVANLKEENAEDFLMLYTDIYSFADGCRYKSCNHIDKTEDECAVVRALSEGKLAKERFDRFYKIYSRLSGKRKVYDKKPKRKGDNKCSR
ncbi:MAG: ribosome small subunit-dependent GTPase A [Clostridia bacterium]|nr:ribosome small subunit-dependent GTPase A [Clostridia bacterium]